MPQVTVLMTTYNESETIFKEALKSILEQTYKNFKLLIVVDNPNNKQIMDLIKHYSSIDTRISWIVNEENLGLPKSLNKGIELVDTEYIARMDADDIADNKRLEKQMQYAKEHPDVDLFGANIVFIDNKGEILYSRNKAPTEHKKIKKIMKYVNIFSHPTFFGKTSIFKQYKYRPLQYSQDYDLTCRLLENGCKLENMEDYLLKYRLPEKKNEKKILKQRIIYYCIQKNYKKGKLSQTDIEKEIEKELKNIKSDKVAKAISLYDEAFIMKKKNKKFQFIKLLIMSFISSKYQRRQILNLSRYYFASK